MPENLETLPTSNNRSHGTPGMANWSKYGRFGGRSLTIWALRKREQVAGPNEGAEVMAMTGDGAIRLHRRLR